MGFEEIRAGLDKYMAEIDEEKHNAAIALSAKYIVKEHSSLINDGNDLFYVYAHYPTTEPDVMVMSFVSKTNAELFCEALNAENERREADVAKHSRWIELCCPDTYACLDCGYERERLPHNKTNYCSQCGAKMDGESNGTERTFLNEL